MSVTLRDAITDHRPGLYECPLHQSGSRRSVRVSVADDGAVLLYDHGGCQTPAILNAIGLRWSDLFPDRVDDPVRRQQLQHEREVRDGFRKWRESETQRAGQQLRERDTVALVIGDAVLAGVMTEDEAWNVLSTVYDGYSELEYKFAVLRTGTDQEALELHG